MLNNSIPLQWTPQNGYNGQFLLGAFCHNKKIEKTNMYETERDDIADI
jgi:hypothetical protein